ncbi:zinc finger protein 91-like [Phlebotomus argentipes]|uniref:zinc finger protein 91-like n=1 Tax=Phlebotomus argentipes TaxID=94469 RepID=UPI0028929F57|nr:zinc finger protein 91-like [Phlebotomus argentipes]
MKPTKLKLMRQEQARRMLAKSARKRNNPDASEEDEAPAPKSRRTRKVRGRESPKALDSMPDNDSSDDEKPIIRYGGNMGRANDEEDEDMEEEIPLTALKKMKKDSEDEESPASPSKDKNGGDVIEFINIDKIEVKEEDSDDDSDEDEEEEEVKKPVMPKKKPKNTEPVPPAPKISHVPHIVKQDGLITVYQCSKCPKTYARPSRLRRHYRKHTGDVRVRWYNCNICHKQFSTDPKLEKHLLRRHKEKLNLFDAVAVRDEVASAEAAAAQAAAAQAAQNSMDDSMFNDEEVEIKPELVQVKMENFYDEYEEDIPSVCPKVEVNTLDAVKRERRDDEDSVEGDFDHFGDHFADNYDDFGEEEPKSTPKISATKPRASKPVDPFTDDRIPILPDFDFTDSEIVDLSPLGRDEIDFMEDIEIESLSPLPDEEDEDFDPNQKTRVYKCTYCPKTFVVRENYLDHIDYHTKKDKPFPCEQCDEEFLTQGTLHYHIESSHLRARCEVCDEETGNLRAFLKHQRLHSKRIRYKYSCDMCEERFTLKQLLSQHVEETHGTGHFKCANCPMTFSNSRFFIIHATEYHEDPKPFRCDFCSFSTNKIYYQSIHMRTHLNEFPYRCLDCMKLFRLDRDLMDHMKDHEENKVTKFRCDKCGKYFATNSNVHRHMRRYCKKYQCEFCDKVFSSAPSLKQHKSTHTDELPFKCDECGQGFPRPEGARVHMRVHTNDRPYGCRICGRTFPSSARRRAHEKHHLGDVKKHRCEDCNMEFKLKKDREEHLLTHVNHAKYFWCALCDQRFMKKQKLVKHLNEHRNTPDDAWPARPKRKRTNRTELEMGILRQCYARAVLKAQSQGRSGRMKKDKSDKTEKSCEHCGKKYKLERRLKKHIQTVHNNGQEGQESVQAGSSDEEIEFINIQDKSDDGQKQKFLTSLVRTTQTGEKEYLCAICEKAYPRPSRLRRHFRKHTGERRTKWFNCSVCSKQFSTEKKLQKHNLRRHASLEDSSQDNDENTVISQIDGENETHEEDAKLKSVEMEDNAETNDAEESLEQDIVEGSEEEEAEEVPKPQKKRGPKPKQLKRTTPQKRGGPFKCTFCRLSYSAQKFLDRHLVYHTEKEKPFPCKSCDMQFDKSCELRFHREKVHAQEKCNVCGEMVMSLHDRQRHKTMHAEDKYRFECEICHKRLCRLQSLQHHIERTHMGDKFKCEICLKGFPRVGLLMAHSIARHSDDKPFSCKMCGFKVNRMASLRSHMITHTKEKNFHCETCGKAFGHSSTFYKHLRMHERAKMPAPKVQLEEVARVRATRERLFQCEVCAKAFIRMADLKLHLRFHSNVRPYKCTVCPKSFHSSSIMKNHLDRHFGIRKHVCRYCGNTYTDPTGLRRHLVKHGDSAVKTFDCELCGKVFVQKYQLTRHASTHIPGSLSRRRGGVQPQVKRQEYKCSVCRRTYINKTGLKKHLQKHGDQCGKQIGCPQCGKLYLDAEELGRHLDTHVNPIVVETSCPSLIVPASLSQDITQIIILPTDVNFKGEKEGQMLEMSMEDQGLLQ